jgi:hypothetical protein
MLAETLKIPGAVDSVLTNIYPGALNDLAGSGVRAGGVLAANNWLQSLEELGLDTDSLHDLHDVAWDKPCPFRISYVGYTNTPNTRLEEHKTVVPVPEVLIVGRNKRPASLNHLIPAVSSKVLREEVVWEGAPVWVPWTGKWEHGKLAEFLFAEICSMSGSVYAWEGGCNVNVSPKLPPLTIDLR